MESGRLLFLTNEAGEDGYELIMPPYFSPASRIIYPPARWRDREVFPQRIFIFISILL
jgi:hypothetical protein